jgi:uncharacterized protein
MILYLGSSSLVKLYVEEPSSDVVADWVAASEIVATCRIAYTEVLSALDAHLRKGDLSREDYDKAMGRFTEDWQSFAKVDFDDFEAGSLISKYGLTRFGALHLSAAKLIFEEFRRLPVTEGTSGDHSKMVLFFSSIDKDLCKAATAEGLKVLSLA